MRWGSVALLVEQALKELRMATARRTRFRAMAARRGRRRAAQAGAERPLTEMARIEAREQFESRQGQRDPDRTELGRRRRRMCPHGSRNLVRTAVLFNIAP